MLVGFLHQILGGVGIGAEHPGRPEQAIPVLRAMLPSDAKVGITLNFSPADPASPSAADAAAAHHYDGFFNRWYLHPLLGWGYPEDMLRHYADQGLMNANNVPVYLAEIVYGRMMMVSVTSTASADDIRASVRASYNSIGGGGSGSVSAKQQTILETAKISIVSVGGPAEATQDIVARLAGAKVDKRTARSAVKKALANG